MPPCPPPSRALLSQRRYMPRVKPRTELWSIYTPLYTIIIAPFTPFTSLPDLAYAARMAPRARLYLRQRPQRYVISPPSITPRLLKYAWLPSSAPPRLKAPALACTLASSFCHRRQERDAKSSQLANGNSADDHARPPRFRRRPRSAPFYA